MILMSGRLPKHPGCTKQPGCFFSAFDVCCGADYNVDDRLAATVDRIHKRRGQSSVVALRNRAKRSNHGCLKR
jgi:hypothetical protein